MIDRINILQATKLAMTDALRRMPQQPDHLVIDALSLRDVDLPQAADHRRRRDQRLDRGGQHRGQGDARSPAPSSTRYPAYGFARNKGYGTRYYVEALLNEGPCEWHRRSFAPLRLLAGEQLSLDLLFDDQMPTEDDFDPDDELAPEELIAHEPQPEGEHLSGLAAAGVIHCSPPTGG